MKTRAFKKVLSVVCVIALLMSVCIVGLVGTTSAAEKTYTFNVNGAKTQQSLAEGATLPTPDIGLTFLGWYDKTFTTKYTTAGAETELCAKFGATVYDFENGTDEADYIFNPNNKTLNSDYSGFDFGDVDPTDATNQVLEYNGPTGTYNFALPGYAGETSVGYKLKADTTYTVTFRYYGVDYSGANLSFRILASKSGYIGGIYGSYDYTGYTATEIAEIKKDNTDNPLAARHMLLQQSIPVTNGAWKTGSLQITVPAIDIEHGREYLLFAMYGGDGYTGAVLFDDFIIVEGDAPTSEITFVDNGTESKQTLNAYTELPSLSDPNFLGWYDITLTKHYTIVPDAPLTVYAKYTKVSDTFEDGDSKAYDPNNKYPSANGFDIVVDPADAANRVLTAPLGSTVVDNYAIAGAVGAKGGFTITKGQVYTVKFKYIANGIGANGAKVYFKSVDDANIGSGAAVGELGWAVDLENTATWKEVTADFVLGTDSELDLATYRNLVMAVYGEDSNGTILIDNFSVGPYSAPIAAPDFEMDFEADGGFEWSVDAANTYTKDSGNGYVNRGELITEANNTFFRVSHFGNKGAYIYFTIDDGASQFTVADRGIYTLEFDYKVYHSETPSSIGLVLVKPTTQSTGLLYVKLAEFDKFSTNGNSVADERDDSSWSHVTYTFGTDISEYAGYTSLGLYVYNDTAVPEYDIDLNKLTATVVDFDNIVVKTNSEYIGDGMIIFDSKGGTECTPKVSPSGEAVGALPEPTKFGYDFVAWKYEADSGVKTLTANTIMPGFITNVYAEWALADGAVEFKVHTNVDSYDAKYGTLVAYPGQPIQGFPTEDPQMVGQEFVGWYYDTGFTKPVDPTSAPSTGGDIYAKWGKGNFVCDFDDYTILGQSARAKYILNSAENNYLDWHVGWATTNTGDISTHYASAINKSGLQYQVVNGYEYTVTFKYKLLEGSVNVGAVTNSAAYAWDARMDQTVGENPQISLTNVDAENWQTASFTFTATLADPANNYLALGTAGHGHIYYDDIVVTSDFNNMNIYGSAIIFDTNGGKRLDPISGKPGDKINLPTPSKPGYKFLGWYTDNTFETKFTETVYGTDTVNLIAKWQLGKYVESFEEYPNAVKATAISGAYSLYDSSTVGFDKTNVYAGETSLFRSGNSAGVKAFTTARSAELKLTKGEEYTLKMYVKPTSIGDAAGTISLLSLSTYTGINNSTNAAVITTLADLKEGEWNLVTYTFVADSDFVGIASSAKNDMYFDEISVTLKGYTGSANTGDTSVNPFVILALVILAAGALLVTGKKVFSK